MGLRVRRNRSYCWIGKDIQVFRASNQQNFEAKVFYVGCLTLIITRTIKKRNL